MSSFNLISSHWSGWDQVQGHKMSSQSSELRNCNANFQSALIISSHLDILVFNLAIISHCHFKLDSKCSRQHSKGLAFSACSFLTATEKRLCAAMIVKETCFCYARWNGTFSYCKIKWDSTRGNVGNACVRLDMCKSLSWSCAKNEWPAVVDMWPRSSRWSARKERTVSFYGALLGVNYGARPAG